MGWDHMETLWEDDTNTFIPAPVLSKDRVGDNENILDDRWTKYVQ